MNKFSQILGIITTLSLTAAPAQARPDNPPVVKGMPCIAEVCIGDNIHSLGHIKWDSINLEDIDPRTIPNIKILAVGKATDISAFTPYWRMGRVDQKGIAILSKIKGFCTTNRDRQVSLKGIYTMKNGKKVAVIFNQRISENKSQSTVVTEIIKQLHVGEYTSQQFEEVRGDIGKRYQEIPVDENVPRSMQLSADAVSDIRGVTLVLNQARGIRLDDEELMNFPGCGGDVKIKLD